jgi:hypothetical protein
VDSNGKMVFVFVKERDDGLADVWLSVKSTTPGELRQIIGQVERRYFLYPLRLKNVRSVWHRGALENGCAGDG